MRQLFTSLIAGLLVSISTAVATIGGGAGATGMIQAQNAHKGYVTVSAAQAKSAIAIMVEKDGERTTYKLPKGQASFALTQGSGTYIVRVLEQVQGTKYRELTRQSVEAKLESTQAPYLHSVQEISFNSDSEAVKKAAALTKGLKNDTDKVKAIYNFVTKNISYDYKKAETVASSYLPNVDATLETGLAICYDYASLTAAMLRSQGIPTKLVKGYTKGLDQYHAWNEVYLGGKWQVIDPTLDAPAIQDGGKNISLFKDAALYTVNSIT